MRGVEYIFDCFFGCLRLEFGVEGIESKPLQRV